MSMLISTAKDSISKGEGGGGGEESKNMEGRRHG